jgi:hypothetical protein
MIFPSERPVKPAYQPSPVRESMVNKVVKKKRSGRKHNIPNSMITQNKGDYAKAKLALRASLNNN